MRRRLRCFTGLSFLFKLQERDQPIFVFPLLLPHSLLWLQLPIGVFPLRRLWRLRLGCGSITSCFSAANLASRSVPIVPIFLSAFSRSNRRFSASAAAFAAAAAAFAVHGQSFPFQSGKAVMFHLCQSFFFSFFPF